MPSSFMPTGQEMMRFAPEIVLTLAGVAIMVLEPITGSGQKRQLGILAFFALIAGIALAVVAGQDQGSAFSNLLVIDGFATFFRVLVLAIGAMTILISTNYLKNEGHETGEFYALLLFSIVGQCLMASSNELVMIFIGLEVSSISSYILAGFLRDDKRNNESALKYFLLGSFATAFLLYGVAWIYGLTGSTMLPEVRRVMLDPVLRPQGVMVPAAMALMFVGFAFKVSAAPFQMWTPDVYQGAPAPVSGFLSVGPKAAAFAMFLRVAQTAFSPAKSVWEPLLWLSALATMFIGNFAALRQTNIKRMLAYSSIAHAGYVMVAITAGSEIGAAAAMFYLAVYAFTNLGAFGVVTHIARKGEKRVEISDLAGLGQRQPVIAALLTVFLLSLIGIPLTGGFFGKFYIFKAALDSNLIWLTVLGLLNSAVAAYYYLRVMVVMYMQPPAEGEEELEAPGAGITAALWISAAATLILGVFPSVVLDYVGRSASLIR